MKVLIASLIIVGIQGGYWITAGESPALLLAEGSLSAKRDLLLLVIGTILFIEGVRQVLVPARSSTVAPVAPGPDSDLPEVSEVTSYKKECESLRTALRELEQRLAQLKKEPADAGRQNNLKLDTIYLLSLFQEKGRLVDFLMEDIATFSDQQVGAAARVVHQGCSVVLRDYFRIAPVHQGNEGEMLTLEKQFSPKQFRLLGSVRGEPPFTGKVLHRGWRALEVKLPQRTEDHDTDIIAPTEVEL